MLELKNINKDYVMDSYTVHALKNVSIAFRDSEFVAILGSSGSGKTTCLNIVGGLDRYTDGDLIIDGISTKEYKDKDWDYYRNKNVGFVFQSYNLIPHQTVLSNVKMALTIGNEPKSTITERAKEALIKVGLEKEMNKYPNQLSGGQMQRVAIARAIVNKPTILLADEPTGALDSKTSLQVLDILKELSKECLVVMVTHNNELANSYASRIVSLHDGEIINDTDPYVIEKNKEEKVIDKTKKKVGMPFFTAIKLSLANLKSKIGRTILTCFAGSIGIIGIALILSMSNGFNKYVNSVEVQTMSQYPITIEKVSYGITSLMTSLLKSNENKKYKDDKITPNYIMVDLLESLATNIQENDLPYFKTYLDEHMSEIEKFAQVTYNYSVSLNVYTDSDKSVVDENTPLKQALPFKLPSDASLFGFNASYLESIMSNFGMWDKVHFENKALKDQYEVVSGSWATNTNEIMLVLNKNNQMSDFCLYSLGLVEDGDNYVRDILKYVNKESDVVVSDTLNLEWDFDSVIGKEYYVVPVSSYYLKDEGEGEVPTFTYIKNDDNSLKTLINDEDKVIKLKVSGIIRPNPGSDLGSLSGVVAYDQSLLDKIIDMNNNSEITLAQKANPNRILYNYNGEDGAKGITFEEYKLNYEFGFNTQTAKNQFLKQFGYTELDKPNSISIYPNTFKDKDKINEFLDNYNKSLLTDDDPSNDDKVVKYSDTVDTIMGSVSTIINAITYVLIAFVSISLVVSSIMIAIITYISVLERTKEIGILRAMGASKRDVKNIFNAETFITGLISGFIGVGLCVLLNIPISLIVKSLAGIANIAQLPLIGGISLVVISFLLSIISGLIPSSLAAKCDPVVALRSE